MKNKKIAIVTSALSIASAGLLAVNIADNFSVNYPYLLRSMSEANSVSIIRSSGFEGTFLGVSTVTATTEKGNSLEFGANHFDVRNKGTQWNDCLVFCTTKGQSTLWNKTELYGITSIKVYSYDHNNPDSYASLSSVSFTFYYGYELIDFDDEYYVAKQTTTSGKIEFAAGYEPSFFGIKCNTDYDLCISKIEVNYQCERVSGELVTYDEACGYTPEGEIFEYTNGNSVVTREIEHAPLARETLALESPKDSWYGTSSYNVATHTWMNVPNPRPDTGSEMGDFLQLTRSDGLAYPGRVGRDTILVTFMISKGDGFVGWSGMTDVYLGVNRGSGGATAIQNRFSSSNPTAGATAWTSLSSGFEIYDAVSGSAITADWWDKKVTVEFDVSSVADVYNVAFGTSNAYVTFTMYDISFRDSCTHDVIEDVSTGYSFGNRCHRCHKLFEHYVDELQYVNYPKKPENFTYQTGVSFGGFEDCLKTTTPVKTNNAEGGWSQNYQLRLKGLIANARAAGLTTIKFKTYIQAPVNTNIRFLWGLCNGNTITSVGQFDHYNGPINFAGNDLAPQMVTSITLLDGSPAGDSGRTNAGRANVWLQVTMDISSSDYAGQELFFSPAVDFSDQNHYPINVYFANLQLLANA